MSTCGILNTRARLTAFLNPEMRVKNTGKTLRGLLLTNFAQAFGQEVIKISQKEGF